MRKTLALSHNGPVLVCGYVAQIVKDNRFDLEELRRHIETCDICRGNRRRIQSELKDQIDAAENETSLNDRR